MRLGAHVDKGARGQWVLRRAGRLSLSWKYRGFLDGSVVRKEGSLGLEKGLGLGLAVGLRVVPGMSTQPRWTHLGASCFRWRRPVEL